MTLADEAELAQVAGHPHLLLLQLLPLDAFLLMPSGGRGCKPTDHRRGGHKGNLDRTLEAGFKRGGG